MRHGFSIVIATLALLTSCQKTTPVISVTPNKIDDMPAAGGACTVKVTSNGEWRTSTDDGVAVNPSSGSGNASVTVTVPANATGQARDVKVTFCSALNSSIFDTVTIHQKSGNYSVSPQEIKDVPASGTTVDVYVTSNGKWETTPDDGIKVNPPSGDSGKNVKVSITVPANTSSGDRERKVEFFSELNGDAAQIVTIYQKAPSISVKEMSNNVTAVGGTVKVEVASDGGWDVKIPSVDGSYKVTPSECSDFATQSATITVYANTTKREREMKVEFCSVLNDQVSAAISIPQDHIRIGAAFSAGEPDEVSVSGGPFKMTLISNGDWKTSIGEWTSGGQTLTTADNVTLSPSWGHGKDAAQTVEATVPANSSGKERSVKVKFYSIYDNSIFETVTICQKGQ